MKTVSFYFCCGRELPDARPEGVRGRLARTAVLAYALMTTAGLIAPCTAAAAPIEVIDDAGRHLVLQAPARRIVALSPHATELVFEIDAGDALLAVSEASDYPEAASRLPRIGGAAGIDLERILALKPDLVIAWQSGNARGQIEALEHAGINVFESDPKTIEQIATSLERLGRLTGHDQLANARAASFRSTMQALADKERVKPRLAVFYQISERPIFTLGAPHLVSRLIETCGAENAFEDIDALAAEVSSESVVMRHPDLIVTDPEHVAELARKWQTLGAIRADGKTHVVGIDADLLTRATPRVTKGTGELCAALDRLRVAAP